MFTYKLLRVLPKSSSSSLISHSRSFRTNSTLFRKDVALIGVPFSGGQRKDGVQLGPKTLRDAGIVEMIEKLGRKVTDYGDVTIPEFSSQSPELTDHGNGYKLQNTHVCGVVSQWVADAVEKGAREDKICVTLGGDHSIATGTLLGHHRVRPDMCVIWVDAHNDLNTFETTYSGNLHGMCLSFVLKGLVDSTWIPGYEWTAPCLKPSDIVYIGLRDTDTAEYKMAEELGIPRFSMHDIDKYGIAHVIERAVEIVNPEGNRPIHVSYDIDSIDPLHTPCTGTPVPGGLTLREGLYIGEYINKLGLLAGLDIVELNPKLGKGENDINVTVNTSLSITEACLGKHRSGYISEDVWLE